MLREPLIAHGVPAVFGVLAAIDLDHDTFLSTDKIDDIWSIGSWRTNLNSSSDRERRYYQSFRSARVECLRSCLANSVFVTLAPRMR
jgi:hypothetical protein